MEIRQCTMLKEGSYVVPLVTSEGTLQVIKIIGIPTTSSFGLSYAKRGKHALGS